MGCFNPEAIKFQIKKLDHRMYGYLPAEFFFSKVFHKCAWRYDFKIWTLSSTLE